MKSMNSIPPKRHYILDKLKCSLIWILRAVSLGKSLGCLKSEFRACPLPPFLVCFLRGHLVLFYVSQVLGLDSLMDGKHASAHLSEEKEMGTKERGLLGAVGIRHHLLSPPGPDYSVIYSNMVVKLPTHFVNMRAHCTQFLIFCFVLFCF